MQYPQRTLFPFVRNAVSCRKFSLQQCDKSLDTLCTVLQSYRAICFCNQDALSEGTPCMSCVTQQSLQSLCYRAALPCNQDTLSAGSRQYIYRTPGWHNGLFYRAVHPCNQETLSSGIQQYVYICNQDGTLSCIKEQFI